MTVICFFSILKLRLTVLFRFPDGYKGAAPILLYDESAEASAVHAAAVDADANAFTDGNGRTYDAAHARSAATEHGSDGLDGVL